MSRTMEILRELGALALASRLRRLADRLDRDVAQLERSRGLDLEPRWKPVLWVLARDGALTSAEIADALGLSRGDTRQAVSALERRGFLERRRDPGAKQRLALTAVGRDAAARAETLRTGILAATQELLSEAGGGSLDRIAALEAALDDTPLAARLRQHIRFEPHEIEIVGYRPAFRRHFERINREWIEALFAMEPEDERLLADPNGQIIRRGGEVLFALVYGLVVGTTALIDRGGGHVELAKMAVTRPWRGLGIGRRLAEAAIERARQRGAHRVTLLTNAHLRRAMVLYLSLGFTAKTDQESAARMARPSLVMELHLDETV